MNIKKQSKISRTSIYEMLTQAGQVKKPLWMFYSWVWYNHFLSMELQWEISLLPVYPIFIWTIWSKQVSGAGCNQQPNLRKTCLAMQGLCKNTVATNITSYFTSASAKHFCLCNLSSKCNFEQWTWSTIETLKPYGINFLKLKNWTWQGSFNSDNNLKMINRIPFVTTFLLRQSKYNL